MNWGWIQCVYLTSGSHLSFQNRQSTQPLNAVNSPVSGRTEPRSQSIQTLWTTEGKECFKYTCLDFMDMHQIKRKKLTKNMHLYSNKVISKLQVSIYISQKQTWKCQLFEFKKTPVDSVWCYSNWCIDKWQIFFKQEVIYKAYCEFYFWKVQEWPCI